jgi:5'-nucleotidase
MATILVDIDDTIAGLLDWWLKLYNCEYGDNLTKEQIDDWDMTRYVKCGKEIYKYLGLPNLYDGVKVIEGAEEGIAQLRETGHRIVFASSGIFPSKRDWLYEHKFVTSDKDIAFLADKSLLRADYMIDDGWHNLCDFKGMGVLFHQKHNSKYDYPYRAHNWVEAVRYIRWFETAKLIFGVK